MQHKPYSFTEQLLCRKFYGLIDHGLQQEGFSEDLKRDINNLPKHRLIDPKTLGSEITTSVLNWKRIKLLLMYENLFL